MQRQITRFLDKPAPEASYWEMPLGKRNVTDVLRRLGTIAAGFAVAAGLVQCGRKAEPEPPKRPNILLIMIDATRADALSCYGYPRQTTPFLDALAAEGVRFESAYAPCSWTVPSVASTLTSTWVNQHGLGKRFRGVDTVSSWMVVPDDVPNLAQLMADGGYRTFGLVANMNLAAERGFDRGFQRYECLGSVDADAVRTHLDSWVPEIAASEEPWFFWLFLFDPHGPYDGREPWLDEFDPEWRRAERMSGFPPTKFSQQAKKLSEDEVAVARACYDSEIRAADDLIREVFEALPGADDAFVVVTADHGEEFLEHGGTLHGWSLYDESVRIPFIVRAPERKSAGTVVSGPVSLVDVLPTVLGAAGIAAPPDAEGIDLMTPDGAHVPAGRRIFAELRAFRAVIDEHFKLIITMGYPDRDMLFERGADPGESNNLVAEEADRAKAMKDLVTVYERAGRVNPPESIRIDRHTIEKLRGLGYVGGGG
jgi:arylsulfatase A-like enzyme